MRLTVVDASVAAKWYLPENGSDQAITLLTGDCKLIAPELILTEVSGSLARRARDNTIPVEELRQSQVEWVQAVEREVVSLTANRVDLSAAFDLAVQLNHHLADCLYLAVAIRLNAPLVTADRPFAKRAESVYKQLDLIAC